MELPVRPLGQFSRRYGFSLRYGRWLAQNAGRFDVAIVHGIWGFASVGAWRAFRRTGTPYVLFTHGMMDPWFREAFPIKHSLKDIYWRLVEGRVLRDAARVLFTSQDELELARQLYPRARYDGRVIPYGTSGGPETTDRFKRYFPQIAGRRYLLFLSRIHPKKGCDLALAAFGAIANQYPELDLVMAGPDQVGWASDLQREAQALGIGDRVHWPGMLKGDAKWAAFNDAEAFLLPSHSENFGIVVAEALASGLPVLTTRKVNIWREVETAGAGLVAEDTQAGVSDIVATYLALPAHRQDAIRRAARPCFDSYFNIDRSVTALAETLAEVAAEASAGGIGLPVSSARSVR